MKIKMNIYWNGLSKSLQECENFKVQNGQGKKDLILQTNLECPKNKLIDMLKE